MYSVTITTYRKQVPFNKTSRGINTAAWNCHTLPAGGGMEQLENSTRYQRPEYWCMQE